MTKDEAFCAMLSTLHGLRGLVQIEIDHGSPTWKRAAIMIDHCITAADTATDEPDINTHELFESMAELTKRQRDRILMDATDSLSGYTDGREDSDLIDRENASEINRNR